MFIIALRVLLFLLLAFVTVYYGGRWVRRAYEEEQLEGEIRRAEFTVNLHKKAGASLSSFKSVELRAAQEKLKKLKQVKVKLQKGRKI